MASKTIMDVAVILLKIINYFKENFNRKTYFYRLLIPMFLINLEIESR